jgi:hypothetical protein
LMAPTASKCDAMQWRRLLHTPQCEGIQS